MLDTILSPVTVRAEDTQTHALSQQLTTHRGPRVVSRSSFLLYGVAVAATVEHRIHPLISTQHPLREVFTPPDTLLPGVTCSAARPFSLFLSLLPRFLVYLFCFSLLEIQRDEVAFDTREATGRGRHGGGLDGAT